MAIKKIHIIGGSGSGKTYIGQILSKKLNIKIYDLDEIFWDNSSDSYGTKTDKNKRDKNLQMILKSDSWIIEGVFYSWLQDSFRKSDIVFILKPNVYIRDWRIIKRFIKRKFGLIASKRESIKSLVDLLKWNHKYDNNNLKEAEKMIDELNPNKIIVENSLDILKIIDRYL